MKGRVALTSSSSSLPGSAARCPLAAPPPLGVPVVPHPLYSTDHSSFVFRRASVPFSLAASRLRASVSPCFHASLASPRCLCPSLTAPPLRPSRLVSLPRAYSCGFHFRQSPGLGLNSIGFIAADYEDGGWDRNMKNARGEGAE
ncbi:uncharacterized protein DS421_9g270260 [Arachis hypogaea]|nr:uncharacterized protein DS421_9g270260 [Arachis hypogaea]